MTDTKHPCTLRYLGMTVIGGNAAYGRTYLEAETDLLNRFLCANEAWEVRRLTREERLTLHREHAARLHVGLPCLDDIEEGAS